MNFRPFFCIKKQLFCCAFTLWVASITNYATAIEVKSLYEAELPVSTEQQQGTAFQSLIAKEAFRDVLIKATGSESILTEPNIANALDDADKYVSQISYGQSPTFARMVKVKFSENMIKSLLAKANKSVWSQNRPLTLVWLIMEENNALKWVSEDSLSDVKQQLANVANRRSLPILFPMLDLTDTAIVTEQDVLNNNFEPLKRAASRYNTQTILLGKIRSKEQGLTAEWTLLKGEESIAWNNTEGDIPGIFNKVIDDLSHKLQGESGEVSVPIVVQSYNVLLAVSGLLNVEQYAKVVNYLKKLPSVTDVEVAETKEDKTIFDLHTTASKDTIVRTIAHDNFLLENLDSIESPKIINYKLREAL